MFRHLFGGVNPLLQPNISGGFCGRKYNAGMQGGFFVLFVGTGQPRKTSQPQAGTYTVTVKNTQGCFGTSSVAVVVNPLPQPNISGS